MNRIYQGRVTNVEVFKDGKPERLSNWQDALWQHHQLFQDAVNYYTLALAAMAGGVEGPSVEATALRGWATKVRETWRNASRKAETFAGPQEHLGEILNLTGGDDFDVAAKHVLRFSRATPAQRATALMQLLTMKGDLNQVCVDRLPWLATAQGRLGATNKAAALHKKRCASKQPGDSINLPSRKLSPKRLPSTSVCS